MANNGANLNNIYDPLNKLKYIGTKLSDFQEIEDLPKKKKYNVLGKGNFGYTEKMLSKLNNSIYAIKKLKINSPKFDLKSFNREIKIMINLDNENIVKLYGYFIDNEPINKYKEINPEEPNIHQDVSIACIVMEYIPNGTINDLYRNHMLKYQNNFVPIEQTFIIKIFKQILNALIYLEKKSIMHRDIKPDNLLLDQNYNIKIGDFGISAIHVDQNIQNTNNDPLLLSNNTHIGPRHFVSPEIEKNQEYDYRSDIYSLGLTMLCLMSTQYPISLVNNPGPNQSLKDVNINYIDKSYNLYLKKLVLRMIEEDMKLRPHAFQAFEELYYIEKYINNPNNEQIKKFVIRLEDIGTKLSDFEEIQSINKSYTLLGKGNFGYAEKMKSKLNNSVYAIKKIDKNSKKFNENDFFRETEIMIGLYHENIIRFYGYFEDKENINKYKEIYANDSNIQNESKDKEIYCLVLEYAANGSLESYYKNHMKNYPNPNYFVPIEQKLIIKMLRQALEALAYLHIKGIMHRDIKLDNLLLDDNYNIKITDFGISALYNDQNPLNKDKDKKLITHCTQVGRPDFVSPEIERCEFYDFRADIYSLGLTILCLMSRKYPIEIFKNPNPNIGYKKVYTDFIDNSYNDYLKRLILRMIDNKIYVRPDAQKCLDEIKYIENFINDPSNQFAKNYLDNINQPKQIKLTSIDDKGNQFNNKNIQTNQNQFSNIQKPNNMNTNIINQYYANNRVLNNPTPPNQLYNQYDIHHNNQNTNEPNTSKSSTNISIYLRQNNTSLIRVLQCLYIPVNKDIKNTNYILNYMLGERKKELLSYKIINTIDYIATNYFSNCVVAVGEFRRILSKKVDIFQGYDEIEPKWIFYFLFKIFNDEFLNYKITWINKIFDERTETNVPINFINNAKKNIDSFKEKYRNTFVDNFYFILLNIVVCTECGYKIDIKSNLVTYYIELPASSKNSISELIYKYMSCFNDNMNNGYFDCVCCRKKVIGIKNKSFLNTPKYLLIEFKDNPKNEKQLELQIDLAFYACSNKGPRKYLLFALICRDNYNKYLAYIRINGNWFCYYGENNCQQVFFESINQFSPYFAIYEGIDSN